MRSVDILKRVLFSLAAVVGIVLVGAAGVVLVDGSEPSAEPASPGGRANIARPVIDSSVDDAAVRVSDPLLVVNKDGSAALGAYVENGTDVEVALMGVVVWVDRHRLAVNSTEMWLPVAAGRRAQVGAASDAGGFVVPTGVGRASAAAVEFRFDDGTCVLADVPAVSRTNEHELIFPRSRRTIGPVTSDEPPAGTTSCAPE